jgi:hypothetical protein
VPSPPPPSSPHSHPGTRDGHISSPPSAHRSTAADAASCCLACKRANGGVCLFERPRWQTRARSREFSHRPYRDGCLGARERTRAWSRVPQACDVRAQARLHAVLGNALLESRACGGADTQDAGRGSVAPGDHALRTRAADARDHCGAGWDSAPLRSMATHRRPQAARANWENHEMCQRPREPWRDTATAGK